LGSIEPGLLETSQKSWCVGFILKQPSYFGCAFLDTSSARLEEDVMGTFRLPYECVDNPCFLSLYGLGIFKVKR